MEPTFCTYDVLTRKASPPIGDRVRLLLPDGEYVEVTAEARGVEVRVGMRTTANLVIKPECTNVVRIVAIPDDTEGL